MHVLRGARRLLMDTPNLAIEIHPGPIEEFGGKVEDLFSLIDTKAYDFFLQFGTTSEPEPFVLGTKIEQNAHLFAIRRSRTDMAN